MNMKKYRLLLTICTLLPAAVAQEAAPPRPPVPPAGPAMPERPPRPRPAPRPFRAFPDEMDEVRAQMEALRSQIDVEALSEAARAQAGLAVDADAIGQS